MGAVGAYRENIDVALARGKLDAGEYSGARRLTGPVAARRRQTRYRSSIDAARCRSDE